MNNNVRLTRRERQIAEMIAWGSAKKEIADLLSLSVNTIDNTARSIYEKIGINKASELSAWWFCSNYKVPFEDAPLLRFSNLKKGIIALFLLAVIIPREIFTLEDTIRVMRSANGRRVGRSGRRINEFDVDGADLEVTYIN